MINAIYQHHKKLAAQRKERLTTISQLIGQYEINNHEQFVKRLMESGIQSDVTTVSRDLQDLQVRKTSWGSYVLPDEREVQQKRRHLEETLNKYVKQFNSRVEFLVIRTESGHEDSIANAIESCVDERIIGTITGRNTVLVMAEGDPVGQEALLQIRELGTHRSDTHL